MYQMKVDGNAGVSLQHRTPNELIHLIRKLRWMGMEDGPACSLSRFAWRERDRRFRRTH